MPAPRVTPARSRRTKIATTIGALALLGVAGGYGTYSAFSDTSDLQGSANAGTVQLNEAGADWRKVTVSDLLPGQSASTCFVLEAPTSGNTHDLGVELQAAPDSTVTGASTAADSAFASALTVGLERVDGDPGASNATSDETTATLKAGDACSDTDFLGTDGATASTIDPVAIPSISDLSDPFDLARGDKATYRVTIKLDGGATNAAAGGAAGFKLSWTGTAKS
ncbi:hypothetical protein ACVU7I_10390 [Patulibacter sp. S7RM1-6]